MDEVLTSGCSVYRSGYNQIFRPGDQWDFSVDGKLQQPHLRSALRPGGYGAPYLPLMEVRVYASNSPITTLILMHPVECRRSVSCSLGPHRC